MSSVTINGNRVPSAEGDTRNVQLDLIPADMIQTIEVNKVVTRIWMPTPSVAPLI